jgi:hypothetical protein
VSSCTWDVKVKGFLSSIIPAVQEAEAGGWQVGAIVRPISK